MSGRSGGELLPIDIDKGVQAKDNRIIQSVSTADWQSSEGSIGACSHQEFSFCSLSLVQTETQLIVNKLGQTYQGGLINSTQGNSDSACKL